MPLWRPTILVVCILIHEAQHACHFTIELHQATPCITKPYSYHPDASPPIPDSVNTFVWSDTTRTTRTTITTMGQPWLDDLSEEWIAQPTPSATTDEASNSLSTQVSQSVPPKPQSRLPRMRQSSGSLSEIQTQHNSKEIRPSRRRSALVERSLSDNNISQPASTDASVIAASRYASQSFSAASLDSILYDGTVAQKPVAKSPTKDVAIHNTPEWRRRLLEGKIGYGDQKDLFSPMGLENIFAKPNSTTSEEKPKRKLGLLKGISAMPSSPPPWPFAEREAEVLPEDERIEHHSEHQPRDQRDVAQHSDDCPHMLSGGLSSLGDDVEQQGGTRTVSGQIEFENENFSPVYLTTNLKVGADAAPIPNFRGAELANRLRQLGTPPPNHAVQPIPDGSASQDRETSYFARLQDDSLPEDLPAGTPDLADVGRFVEMQRGGYSRDGSFRRRPLSPSPQRPLPQSRLSTGITLDTQASNDTTRTSNGITPKTPHRKGHSKSPSVEQMKSSGSPLKLFDAHDTFTSNRLQRRLSQLERKSEKAASSSIQTNNAEATKLIQKSSLLTSVEEMSIRKGPVMNEEANLPQSQGSGTFGRGELNRYQFSGDFSALSSPASDNQSAPEESPSMDAPPPGSRLPLKFQYAASPISCEPSRAKRQGLTRVSNPFRTMSQSKAHVDRRSSAAQQETTEQTNEYAEGKRGPTSPFKNPTPKRRRTTQSMSDDEDDMSDNGLHSVKDSHAAMQSIIGRKRKDARPDNSNNVADPEVLARRHILRPRNPTPSQRRLEELNAEIIEATEAFMQSSPKMNTIREQIDQLDESDAPAEESRAAIVANEVAAFSMRRQQVTRDESRKRSVTTQDFLDEAVKIMDYIRTKGRPTSGLGSLEETEDEAQTPQEKNGYPSSSLTFDRPPSREGRLSAWKEPNKQELDPQVMSHLRKFQERESDDVLGSSFHSLRFSRMKAPAYSDEDSIVVEQDGIRIIDNPNRHVSTDGEHSNPQPRTNGTNPSSGSSLGQTVATNTSRRSDHVVTLAPEAVAHLIPQEVAGMSFDRENNLWVRHKSPLKEVQVEEGVSGTNESEDDPFGHIPDLTVDETAERMMHEGSPSRPQATAETILEDSAEPASDDKTRPITREGRGTVFTDTSSVPSKVSNFAWSFPKTETRATSWSDQETRHDGTQKAQQPPTTYAIPETEESDIEHEIQYFEGRGSVDPSLQNSRVRDITISIAEHGFGHVSGQFHQALTPQGSAQQKPNVANHNQYSSPKKAAWTRARTLPKTRQSRRTVVGNDGDLPQLEGLPPRNYHMQLSMSVSAPVLKQQDALLPPPSSPAKADVTFILSDLPDFTLNQIDECELPNRMVVKQDGHIFSRALEDRYALGTADLVKALQDAEPDQPYWEDLRQVNLHNKGLENLHRLDDFCVRLEELDISDNGIGQTRGMPYTLRRLRAQNNCLTGLTSWTTLTNLQYLDISKNDIDSLDGLSELVHLRTLKADDNKIKSLDGVLHLDGLIEFSAARNQIEFLDFAKADLYVYPINVPW
jgi:hypothetical protein